METQSKSTWIWYPGDFEIWLGNIMNGRRTERGAFFPPFWKMDSHYVTVEFSKVLELDEDDDLDDIPEEIVSEDDDEEDDVDEAEDMEPIDPEDLSDLPGEEDAPEAETSEEKHEL